MRRIALAALLLLPAAALARSHRPHAHARPVPDRTSHAQGGAIQVESGSGRVVNLPSPASNIFVADPKVAEIRPASATALFVFGTAPGRTTVAAMDASGRTVAQFDLTVTNSAFDASQAQGAIAKALPGRDVQIGQTAAGLTIHGTVRTPAEAEEAATLARSYLNTKQRIENRLVVASPIQVSLRVRIAEVSRTVLRGIGINWQAIQALGKYAAIGTATANPLTALGGAAPSAIAGSYVSGNANINAVIDALAQDNLVRVLAEPNLTTMSGESASFLVGGEFPIPIAQQFNTVTVTFKEYGVNLAFVPTVMADSKINIHVRPEVSELTNQGAVALSSANNSISIPALTVRRADTTVEVGSGQSFAIAGLLQDNLTQATSALPFLGEIPILGALFRSDSYQRNQTELVIVVTPYIVQPVSDPSAVSLPTDGAALPNDLERLLLLRQVDSTSANAAMHVPGDAGFVVQ